VRVHSRADLPGRETTPPASLAVSSVTGEGITPLLARIAEIARSLLPAEDAITLNRRQAAEIASAHASLGSCAAASDLVVQAEELRSARAAFDRLTGRAGVEDLLDAVFGRFLSWKVRCFTWNSRLRRF